MTHKGYTGRVTDVDDETGVMFGHVVNLCDGITFEASTGPDLVREFRA